MTPRVVAMLRRSVVLFALAGCRLTTGPHSEVSLAVTPAQGSVRAGQNLYLEVWATNTGEVAISLYGPECAFPYEVRAPGGRLVPPPVGLICAPVLVGPVTLGPGQSFRFPSVWPTKGQVPGPPLAAGVYELRPMNFTVRGARVELRSASVTVTE